MDEYGPILSGLYAKPHEVVNSSRYQWNCFDRGKVPFVIFQYTLEGSGCFTLDGETHEVPAGSAFISLLPENGRYFYPPEKREPWIFCWLNFYGEWGLDLWARLRRQFGPVVHIPRQSAVEAELLGFARKVVERKFADRYEAGAEAYSFYINYWRELAQPRRTRADPVEEAVRICRHHYRDPVSVKELAAQSNLSREHFSRLFKERQGVSPAAFLREQRLRAAAQMLQYSPLPVKEVALRTGFYSARHLMKAFTRAYRQTPQQYRRRKTKPGKKAA